MEFKIYDIFHRYNEPKWIYSSDPHFKGKLSLFFSWIEQHQKGYNKLEILSLNKEIECNCINGVPRTTDGCKVHGVKY